MPKINDAKDVPCQSGVFHVTSKCHNCFISEGKQDAFNPCCSLVTMLTIYILHLQLYLSICYDYIIHVMHYTKHTYIAYTIYFNLPLHLCICYALNGSNNGLIWHAFVFSLLHLSSYYSKEMWCMNFKKMGPNNHNYPSNVVTITQ